MRIILIAMLCFSLLVGCSADRSNDFSAWDEERVYGFLNEIESHISKLPVETDDKDKIVKSYEKYFSPELSVKIVDSLYLESDGGWKIPDGDGGYMFTVPNKEQNEVSVNIGKNSIIVEEKYEYWMYSKNRYTITYDKKPLITEWVME